MTNANSGLDPVKSGRPGISRAVARASDSSEAAALAGHQPDSNATASIDRTAAAVAKGSNGVTL